MNTIVALASVSALKAMLEQSVFLGVFLSLGSYGLGMWLKRKTGWALMNPLLIAVVLVVAFLAISGVSYTSYSNGARILDYLLTPATICLAVPLYQQIELLKKNYKAVVAGLVSGVLTSLISVFLLALLFQFDHASYVTFLPKSITTAIGMGISDELGGYVSITVVVILLTGVFGNIFADKILKLFHVEEPIAKGIAIGSAAHAMGTARAMEMGQIEGAMSGLSIVVSGILTVIGASVFAWFI
ncbi:MULTISPECIES: LrgB family protein [Segatella]|jgi:predicted murein hydrolase (TIGR00659 family)|uniref:Negative regulator of murein hydrolase n=2 Tax=Segatella TaxID=2974251 RepID=D8DVX7_9BACT|nr:MULTISPECIES: LrgB family protein [Segatella]EFI72422.1 negative regulator of murein hydrolase [Segatella baroniae B14]UKK75159.1 LrgB family protein [Segatella bryantii]UKK79437.1 LrgB family protein [Segatella baroniae B14]SEQ78666.1 TIGR00659 family protein [Segatella baroniae B14]GJG28239.1 membrane protein [Segatella bryantii]